MRRLGFLLVLVTLNFAQAKDLFIYFVGNIPDVRWKGIRPYSPINSIQQAAINKMEEYVAENSDKYDLVIQEHGDGSYMELADKFRDGEFDSYDRLVVGAHSVGVPIALTLHELIKTESKFKKIDLFLSFDSMNFLLSREFCGLQCNNPLLIGPDITKLINFFEVQHTGGRADDARQGVALRGVQDMSRDVGDVYKHNFEKVYTGIKNVKIFMNPRDEKFKMDKGKVNFHDGLVLEMMDSGYVQDILDNFSANEDIMPVIYEIRGRYSFRN